MVDELVTSHEATSRVGPRKAGKRLCTTSMDHSTKSGESPVVYRFDLDPQRIAAAERSPHPSSSKTVSTPRAALTAVKPSAAAATKAIPELNQPDTDAATTTKSPTPQDPTKSLPSGPVVRELEPSSTTVTSGVTGGAMVSVSS